MSAPLRVLLAPDSGPGVGGGHVLRCIALAQALKARGAACTFVMSAHGLGLFEHYGDGAGCALPLEGDGAEAVAAAAAAREIAADVMVIDSYRADARWGGALGAPRPRLVVIDDLADRRHLCDLLIDPGYGREPQDYAGLVPADSRILAGPTYALLRAAFDGPPLSRDQRPVRRAFLGFGLSDVAAVAARATQRLRGLAPELQIDVALAGDAESLPRLREMASADARLHLHEDARDVAGLMHACDVAVGAGGASTWERCALGLPSLAVIVADNQRRVVRALEADGVLLACDLANDDFEAAFDAGWAALQETERREALSERSRAVCDGRGAQRVADAILAL